jgi:hypothetical protein
MRNARHHPSSLDLRPGLIERFGRQYRADRLHLALVDDLLVVGPCASHLLLQRMGCAPQPGGAPWRRRRRSGACERVQRLDDTRAITQAVQDTYGLGEMLQREVTTSLIAFCQPDFSKGGSDFPRCSALASYLECLLVTLVRCSPLASRAYATRWIG